MTTRPRSWLTLACAAVLCAAFACKRVDSSSRATETQARGSTAAAQGTKASAVRLTHVTRTKGGKNEEPLPWIVAFHGLGDVPEAFIGLVSAAPLRAHIYAPRAPYPFGDGFDWYQVRLDDPAEELARAMQTAVDTVIPWLDEQAQQPQNVGKPIAVGFSQGAMLSFALATQHPDRFQAVIPIAGMLPRPLWPTGAPKARVPILALHGTDDRLIKLGPTEALVKHLEQTGYDITLESFPGVAHRIPMPVRTRLYDHLAYALGQ